MENDDLGTAAELHIYARAVRSMALHELGNEGLAREQLELASEGVSSLGETDVPIHEIVEEAESVLSEK